MSSAHQRTRFNSQTAQEVFKSAARDKRTASPNYDIVRRRMSDIFQGKRPGSDLVIPDEEFSFATRQRWEFSFIERTSGDVLINTAIEHQDGLDHTVLG